MSNQHVVNTRSELLQQAEHLLEKALEHESKGNVSQREMAFKMALKKEAEHFGAQ
jgi:hypothetical protein